MSNFDTRLRRILDDLGIAHLFDAVIVSGACVRACTHTLPCVRVEASALLSPPREASTGVGGTCGWLAS